MSGGARSAHVNVRMTQEERAAIVARSSSFGMAPSTFMREAALLCGEKPVRVADREELSALRTDLKRIGSLLNQCTKALHIYGPSDATLAPLNSAVSNVSDAASRISRLLSDAEGGNGK